MGIDLRGICAGTGDYFGDVDGENVFFVFVRGERFVSGRWFTSLHTSPGGDRRTLSSRTVHKG